MISNRNQNNSAKYIKSRIEIFMMSFLRKNRNAIRYKNNSHQKNNEVSKIDKGSNNVKWTDVAMVVITAILAFYTWKLFNTANTQSVTAIKSTDASIRAANTADATLKEQREINRTQRIADRIKDSTDSLKYIRDTITENKRDLANDMNQERLYKVQQATAQAQIKSVNAQMETAKAQVKQLSEMQFEYKNNHMPLLDYEKTIKDSTGEITLINKGLGIAQILSVNFVTANKLGNYWLFLETVLSPNSDEIFSSLVTHSREQTLIIQTNVSGFDYEADAHNIESDKLIDMYYCNKLKHTFINPSQSVTLLKVISGFPKQMLPAQFTIKYLSSFGDTLILPIKEYK